MQAEYGWCGRRSRADLRRGRFFSQACSCDTGPSGHTSSATRRMLRLRGCGRQHRHHAQFLAAAEMN